jgi:hypothetical protein
MQSVYRSPVYWPDLFCTDSLSIDSDSTKSSLQFDSKKRPPKGGAWMRPSSRVRVTLVRPKPDLSLSVSGQSSYYRPQYVHSRLGKFPVHEISERPVTTATPVRRQLVISPRGDSALRVIRATSAPGLVRIFSPTVVRDRSVRHLLVGPFM